MIPDNPIAKMPYHIMEGLIDEISSRLYYKITKSNTFRVKLTRENRKILKKEFEDETRNVMKLYMYE